MHKLLHASALDGVASDETPWRVSLACLCSSRWPGDPHVRLPHEQWQLFLSTAEVHGHVWQQALLPSFLEMLARDYVSWAKGERRTTGHLAPKALRDSVEPAS